MWSVDRVPRIITHREPARITAPVSGRGS